ncbi:phospholipase A2 inhibitor and Ly6/PLAUR domain-containing protein-like [Hyperolius riggenbachi]|uniref:phospholipase A2 inhibitor and Ly6/PLAUR domain-containing protein-like n=1 Tax=Hyperolius riggenbachi TaxID=752182 RepID=UPI0035A2A78A
MLSFWWLLGVLLTLAKFGHSLSCMKCSNITAAMCTGPSVTCTSGLACRALYAEVSADGSSGTISTHFVGMSCASESQCNVQGSIGIVGGKIKLATSCCTTDNCNVTLPSLPADNSVANGLTCPFCVPSSTSCNASSMQCLGNENQCVLLNGSLTGSL